MRIGNAEVRVAAGKWTGALGIAVVALLGVQSNPTPAMAASEYGLPLPTGTTVEIAPKALHSATYPEWEGGTLIDNTASDAAIDFYAPVGTDVIPIADGKVIDAWERCNVVLVDHGDGQWVQYLHIDVMVGDGVPVSRGTTVLGTLLDPADDTACDNYNPKAHVHIAFARSSDQGNAYESIVGKVLCGHTVGSDASLGTLASIGDAFQVPVCPGGPPSDATPPDDSFSDPSDHIPVAQCVAPAEGAQVGRRLTLVAWPTPVLLNGSLVNDPTTARVDFRVAIHGAKVLACSAGRPDDAGRWTCQADLVDLGVADGDIELTFDVVRIDGGIAPAPDGVRTVVYESPLAATWRTPAKGAKLVKANPRLAAKIRGGSTETDRVIFRVQWGEQKPKRACIAADAGNTGVWSCRADLWKVGAPLGRLKLSFDIVDVSGDVNRSPAGTRSVRFAAPPPRPAPASLRVQPRKVQPCPKLASFRSAHGGCCSGDGRLCDYRYRLSWADTPGEAGYRIYERGVISRTRRSSCTLVDESRTRLITTVPANTTSYTGDFVVTRWDADQGRWRTGATFLVVPYNRAGPARSGVAKGFVFDPSGGCSTGPR